MTLLTIPVFSAGQYQHWLPGEKNKDFTDIHAAFRGRFTLPAEGKVVFHLSGASWYRAWLDGSVLTEGPDRYSPDSPIYQEREAYLEPGEHVLAVQVHSEGVDTRMLKGIEPFLFSRVIASGREVAVEWKAIRLQGYLQKLRRVSDQFGWVEWVDTRRRPTGWEAPGFDDGSWETAESVSRDLGEFKASGISPVLNIPVPYKNMDSGPLADFFGYETDNPSARFFLRDLECIDIPRQGTWTRYDLGRVRLVNPRFRMDLPEGSVVEFAFSEYLVHGRVMPWINLSASDSYNMVHMVARGGIQEFYPLTPKGGRFVELHIIAPPDSTRLLEEQFLERRYYQEAEGAFTSGDSVLDRIWKLGVDTYVACAEDALVDNPTRERGQWMGDVGIVGLMTGSVAFHDLAIIRNGLYQFAGCSREDGMVAGLAPGTPGYLSTYSCLWTNGCLGYWKVTGERKLLEELYPYAKANIRALESYKTADGIGPDAGWAFVDWGYLPNDGPCDMGLNILYYEALKDMEEWSGILGQPADQQHFADLAVEMGQIIEAWFRPLIRGEVVQWEKIGYHQTVLGLRSGFIPDELEEEAVANIRDHILSCFPNNPSAPRLSDPGAANPHLITPYFAHYAFPELIKRGEMEFVLDQYKACWGWMLQQGVTTCLEVFDTRWSHCHQWSGCPTWQLSRYCLGLQPAFDRGMYEFDLVLATGYLEKAAGKIPLPGGKLVNISWKRSGDLIEYSVDTPVPVVIRVPSGRDPDLKKKVVIRNRKTISLTKSQVL